jgi:phosphoglycerate dehydrogenase-like enzyme
VSRAVALVSVSPESAEAAQFRQAIERVPTLQERVELRFAEGAAVREAIAEAEIVSCSRLSSEQVSAAPKLRWIAFWSAGMDGLVTPQLLERRLLLTNSSGVHAPNIAEHVLAFMLMFSRRMRYHLRSQLAGEWQRRPDLARGGELFGETLGIVGLGHIGEALASRAQAFGMRVLATKRDIQTRYDGAVMPDALYPPNRLPELVAESDHVCIALPYTEATHHLFDADLLARMKPSAYLYNIARGKIVDEAALIMALQEGRIAGAGLDVFEEEPLPPNSPLWRMENVLITPHISGLSPRYLTRVAELFAANLTRYLDGRPLHNLYDAERGY